MLSASTRPPASPRIEYRRDAAEPAMPLHHVSIPIQSSGRNSSCTVSCVLRTTHTCES